MVRGRFGQFLEELLSRTDLSVNPSLATSAETNKILAPIVTGSINSNCAISNEIVLTPFEEI